MKFDHLPGDSGCTYRNLPAEQVSNQRAGATVWHLHDVRCSRERLEQFAKDYFVYSCAGSKVLQIPASIFITLRVDAGICSTFDPAHE